MLCHLKFFNDLQYGSTTKISKNKTHIVLYGNITGLSQEACYNGSWLCHSKISIYLLTIWVHKTGFHWSACKKPGKCVDIYMLELSTWCFSVFLILELFWHCTIFCFSFYYLYNNAMFSIQYANIVAKMEEIIFCLFSYYASMRGSNNSRVLIIVCDRQLYHLI